MGGINLITERVTEDTIKLLKECDAGVKIAIESFDEVLRCRGKLRT